MAKRKNKKNKSARPETAQRIAQEALKSDPGPEKAAKRPAVPIRSANAAKVRSAVSIPVFFSGMFLALVLGIYLGTLAPEIIQNEHARTAKPAAETPPAPAPRASAPETPTPQAAPEQANLPRDIATHVGHIKSELARHPDNAALWTELGDLYFDANLPQLAIESYGKALALNPKNADVLTDMGIMYRELGEFNNALDCFRNASQINPGHTQSLYNQGLILSHDLNDRAGAAEAWKKLLRINPDAVSPNGKPVRQMLEELK